jgi:hypothetical protein
MNIAYRFAIPTLYCRYQGNVTLPILIKYVYNFEIYIQE